MEDSSASPRARRPFDRVMLASEGGHGLRQLGRLAMPFMSPHASLQLVEVVCNPAVLFPSLSLDYPDWRDAHLAMLHAARDAMNGAARELARPSHPVETHLIDLSSSHVLDAADALAQSVRTWHADLLAVASHQTGHRWGCRLEPEELVCLVACPVLHVPASFLECVSYAPRRVLFALDGGRTSLSALSESVAMLGDDVDIRVVYVVDRAHRLHDGLLDELFECEGVDALEAASRLLFGRARVEAAMLDTDDTLDDVPAAVLRDAQRWQADLVVMGSEGRGPRLDALPGAVARRALRDASCPVLMYPPVRLAQRFRAAQEAGASGLDPTDIGQALFL